MDKTHQINTQTPFDGGLFAIMAIALNTLVVGYLLILYFKAKFEISIALLWGMRLGIIVFLIASMEGAYMSSQRGHTVGLPDGRNGVPFINWSTQGGDLRVAHFLGLHAIQIIPLAAFVFEWLPWRRKTTSVVAFTAIYLVFFLF